MIPYFQWTHITIFSIPIQVWGLMVALGFIVGAKVAESHLKRLNLEYKIVGEMLGWMALAAILVSRLFHVLLYEPAYYFANPLEIFRIWEGGMSIYGGLIAATITAIVILRRHKLDVWKYADAIVFGLPIGIAVGRLGCFFIHDHPGTATDFFLGVKYPDGITRHDLGLYESLSSLALFFLFLFLMKKRVQEGWYLATFSLWYGATRFLMDFLRVVDTRYLGLTSAQYLSIALFIFGLVCAFRIRTFSRSR